MLWHFLQKWLVQHPYKQPVQPAITVDLPFLKKPLFVIACCWILFWDHAEERHGVSRRTNKQNAFSEFQKCWKSGLMDRKDRSESIQIIPWAVMSSCKPSDLTEKYSVQFRRCISAIFWISDGYIAGGCEATYPPRFFRALGMASFYVLLFAGVKVIAAFVCGTTELDNRSWQLSIGNLDSKLGLITIDQCDWQHFGDWKDGIQHSSWRRSWYARSILCYDRMWDTYHPWKPWMRFKWSARNLLSPKSWRMDKVISWALDISPRTLSIDCTSKSGYCGLYGCRRSICTERNPGFGLS